MLAQQRQSMILGVVRERGAARVADLVAQFGVSDMTIRRDLDVLARRGWLDKVHGGATMPLATGAADTDPLDTSVRGRAEKRGIARTAAALVRPGQVVGLSAGTTTWALAQELVGVAGLTVVTNSPPVGELFHAAGCGDQTVVLTGGVRTSSDALVGPVAVSSLDSINVDTVFLGAHGMEVRSGFSVTTFLEADTNRAMIRAARRLVVLADHTKWGVVGVATVAPLDQADAVVSDPLLSGEARDRLAEHVGDLLIADPVES